MSAPAPLPHQRLRAATQASHDEVDAAFGSFGLGSRDGYVAFLLAHARALPAVETALAGRDDLPVFAPRTPHLMADLQALGQAMPPPLPMAAPRSTAEAWAMLYVREGSRLGGVMLARTVGPDLPLTYLSAGHARGGWRAFLAAFDATAGDEAWIEEATAAARATFALYTRSAAMA